MLSSVGEGQDIQATIPSIHPGHSWVSFSLSVGYGGNEMLRKGEQIME